MMENNDVHGWGAIVDQINREGATQGVVAPRMVSRRLVATDFSPHRKSVAAPFRSTSRPAPVIGTATASWSAVIDLLNQQCAAMLPGFVIPGGNSK